MNRKRKLIRESLYVGLKMNKKRRQLNRKSLHVGLKMNKKKDRSKQIHTYGRNGHPRGSTSE